MSEPLVSVVTPFHNTEAYLAECIESVLGQTYPAFEYILVDNASTDRSGDIAADYARRDPRIRLEKTERLLTQVQNYNFALGLIGDHSRYCKMVQADDWIFGSCLASMVALAERHPSVAVVNAYNVRGYELAESVLEGAGLPPRQGFFTGREASRLALLEPHLWPFGNPTTHLFASSAVRSRTPFFEEGRLWEDVEVVFELLQTGDFGFVHEVLSYCRDRDDGIWMGKRYGHGDFLKLALTRRYGSRCLAPDEREHCHAGYEQAAYQSLAWSWVRRRERGYWAYYERAFADTGLTLQRSLLLPYVGPAIAERLSKRLGRKRAP